MKVVRRAMLGLTGLVGVFVYVLLERLSSDALGVIAGGVIGLLFAFMFLIFAVNREYWKYKTAEATGRRGGEEKKQAPVIVMVGSFGQKEAEEKPRLIEASPGSWRTSESDDGETDTFDNPYPTLIL